MNNILDRIEPQDDGLYFLVDYKKSNTKDDIIEIVKAYNIKNFNYFELEKDIENGEEYVFLTKDKNAIKIDETIDVYISDDKMVAEARFLPPFRRGKLLTKEDILQKIADLNIVFGINLDDLNKFITSRDYSKTYILAKGIYPEESKDGYLEYCIDTSKKSTKPKILEDGSLDYKSLNIFRNIQKDAPLIKKIQPVKGENGKDIYNNEIESKDPKETPDFPTGKNIKISDDEKTLLAAMSGCVMLKKNSIDIVPVLEIESDVDHSTGNIDFVGSVIIKGNVLSGFTVNAKGSVEVQGSVEAATIISGGSVYVAKGVQGGGKAKIVSGENMTLNFVESATLIAEKDISSNSIMHTDILCNGNVIVMGQKGLITGGKSMIAGDLVARYIGSTMSSSTDITVGINYKVLNQYEDLVKKVDKSLEKYEKLERIVEKLMAEDIERLSYEKRLILEKSIKEKLEIKKKILIYKKTIKKLIPFFTSRIAKIQVVESLYGGTRIAVNNAVIYIKEDLDKCTITNVDGKIKIYR